MRRLSKIPAYWMINGEPLAMHTARLKSVFACAAAAFVFACATNAFAVPSWAEKERAIRTSLFAEDNPARYVGQEQYLEQQQNQELRRQQQDQYRQQYNLQRQNQIDQRAQQQQQQQQELQQAQRQEQPPLKQKITTEDGKGVGFAEDGSVQVRTGNKQVDESAGNYLNRKFRGFLNNLWR